MNPNPNNYDGGPISTIYDALDEKQRKKLDNAIVARNPSSLTKVHEIFHLAEKGISQQTLYRYARKVRDQANKLTLMESTFTSEVDVVEHLKNQIGRQCMDMILNADINGITPLDAQRIANAFGKCLQFNLTIARTKALEAANVAAGAPAGRAARATSRLTRQELEVGDDPDAPHGRNQDGSPRTHEQYCATVNKVMFEVFAPKSVKEAAAREAAEKAAAAKQNPDRSCDPAEIDASGPDPFIGNPGASNCAGSPVRAGSAPGFSHDPSGESLPLSPPDQSRKSLPASSLAGQEAVTTRTPDPPRSREIPDHTHRASPSPSQIKDPSSLCSRCLCGEVTR